MDIETIYGKLWKWCEIQDGRSFSINIYPHFKINKHSIFLHLPGKKRSLMCTGKHIEILLTIL